MPGTYSRLFLITSLRCTKSTSAAKEHTNGGRGLCTDAAGAAAAAAAAGLGETPKRNENHVAGPASAAPLLPPGGGAPCAPTALLDGTFGSAPRSADARCDAGRAWSCEWCRLNDGDWLLSR